MNHTAAEQRHLDRVASLPCIVGHLGFDHECGGPRLEIHHLREGQGAAQRAGHFLTVRVCWNHHTGPFGVHSRREFERRTKLEELDLLNETYRLLYERSR